MNWQTVTAWIIVTLAGLWMVRRAMRVVAAGSKGGPEVSSCAGCPKSSSGNNAKPLVSLGKRPERLEP